MHVTPDAETVAAIFGSPPASEVLLTRADGSVVEPTGAARRLALMAGETYTVTVTEIGLASLPDVVPIKSVWEQLGGEDDVAALSHAFYRRVFADESDAAFRAFFVATDGSAEAAAEQQWRWLVEMWGGPARYTERHGDGALVTRMLGKHAASRMTFRFCERWLVHMLAATDEVCMAGHSRVGACASLPRYWLHFFGFFPLLADERRKLRMLALGPLPRGRRQANLRGPSARDRG